MKAVHQTIFAGPGGDDTGRSGNCFATAIASILELPLRWVPNFADQYGPPKSVWWTECRRWLRSECDIDLVSTDPTPEAFAHYCQGVGFVIGGGPSPRGAWGHVVVLSPDGELAHDPHPSGAGLAGPVEHIYGFCQPYEPTPDEQEAEAVAALLDDYVLAAANA